MAGGRSFYDRWSGRSPGVGGGLPPNTEDVGRVGKPANEPLRPCARLAGAPELRQRGDGDHLALLRQEGDSIATLMFLREGERVARIMGEHLLRASDQLQLVSQVQL